MIYAQLNVIRDLLEPISIDGMAISPQDRHDMAIGFNTGRFSEIFVPKNKGDAKRRLYSLEEA